MTDKAGTDGHDRTGFEGDTKQLELLRRSVAEWNRWRLDNLSVVPDLTGADLREADLCEADLLEAELWEADLSGSNLRGACLAKAALAEANLCEADLEEADLDHAGLREAKLRGAHLGRATLQSANLRNADFTRANLQDAYMPGADLAGARLSGANLAGADLWQANLLRAGLIEANLRGADMWGATLMETDFSGADLTGARVYGAAVWDVMTDPQTRQTGLIITPRDQPDVIVDDLEVAQFMYLLLSRQKLRSVIDAVAQKGVLILGRFGGGGIEVLHAIADRLRSQGYLPMIFDFQRPRDRDYTETVQTLTGLARFVIVDLSGPSVPNELRATVPNFEVPFVPILEEGRAEFSMVADLEKYPWWLGEPTKFSTTGQLLELLLGEVIAPAEAKFEEIRRLKAKRFLGT